jgi:PIN domain nuclease of toxin-antitoxin system
MILLDTHSFVWLACDDKHLGRLSRQRIERARVDGGVAVSAVSYFEIGALMERGRLRLSEPLEGLRARALEAGVRELAVDVPVALLAARLRSFHGDPIDRLLVATAMERSASLMTADAALLAWKAGPTLLDARR